MNRKLRLFLLFAFEEATKLNRQLAKDEYFIDWVIVG